MRKGQSNKPVWKKLHKGARIAWCPTCAVSSGEYCISKTTGKWMKRYSHPARLHAAFIVTHESETRAWANQAINFVDY